MVGIATFVVGLFLWTFLEYVLHRFAFHERKLGRTVAKEHIQHHATPDYFASALMKLKLAIPILGALALLGLLFGVGGLGLVLGVISGWQIYEAIHRATHVRGPRNRYGAWARRHHLHHHFQNARANHGVTTPLWDWVFGTLERPATIRVPKRHVHAFGWLLAAPDDSAVAEAYRGAYEIVGGSKR
ncbi:MAG: sterol desaturase family protein [Sandaracinaceae bacterium]